MEKEKNTKKTNKKPFLVAGFALLLALIGCVGGVTYSKYISKTDVPSTQATVAKWGYVVTGNSDDLFGKKYAKDATTNTAKVDAAGTVIVSATTDTNVVAPGATGSLTVTVKGTAEVMASLTIKLSDVSDISLSDGANHTYNPLKWTAKVGGTAITDAENTTLANVATALSKYSKSFAANETVDTTFTLSYTWEFDGVTVSGLKNGETAVTGDEADTILGMKATTEGIPSTGNQYSYASTWTATNTVKLSLSATLAQVQA